MRLIWHEETQRPRRTQVYALPPKASDGRFHGDEQAEETRAGLERTRPIRWEHGTLANWVDDMPEDNTSRIKSSNEDDLADDSQCKFDIKIGTFSLKTEGKPALIMSELVRDELPTLVELLKSSNWNAIFEHLSPLLTVLVQKFAASCDGSAFCEPCPTDTKNSENDSTSGNAD